MSARDHTLLSRNGAILYVVIAVCVAAPRAGGSAETVSPVLLSEVVATQATSLATIDSNPSAMALFTSTVGPSLGLREAAKTLGARGLPEKSVMELGLAELSQTVHQLMAALSVWQLADAIGRTDGTTGSETAEAPNLPPAARQDWMRGNSRVTSLADLFRAMQVHQPSDSARRISQSQHTELLLTANRVALEASQRATITWWEILRWKDRVRQTWGQSRLCGTWQWIIHNHQNHQERKTVLLFPPPGHVPANSLLPVETVILGDSIYLRWEHGELVQEDSLLFIKEGGRIEGSFENNTGGWGSITAKRTAPCQS
jgi:hypothetical protein